MTAISVTPGTVHASAPTRIDLAGGTLDIWPLYLFYERAVTLNVAIDCYATARLLPRRDGIIRLRSIDQKRHWEGRGLQRLRQCRTLPLLRIVLLHGLRQATGDGAELLRRGFTVETDCAAPAGSGLGGSSALHIALQCALQRFLHRRLDRQSIIKEAQNLETTNISAPTGWQDYYPAAFGGVQALWGEVEGVRREALRLDLDELGRRLVLCYCGVPRRSALNNWRIFRAFFDGDRTLRRLLGGIAESALRLYDELSAGKLEHLAKPIDQEWSYRRRLSSGTSTPDIDRIGRAARRAGAQAMKVCGAGGGGCVFFVTQPRKQQAVSEAVRQAGGQLLQVRPVLRGVRCRRL